MMSEIEGGAHRVIPLEYEKIKSVLDEYTKNYKSITIQLIDPEAGVNYFFKPFLPPEGWKFCWATEIADNPLVNECRYDKDGNFKVVTKGLMKHPPYLQPVKPPKT